MDIRSIIEPQLNKSWHKFRMLSEDRSKGIFSCGYVRKNPLRGDFVDVIKRQYDFVMVLAGRGKYIDDQVGEVLLEPGVCFQRLPRRKHSTIVLDDQYTEFYLGIGEELFNSLTGVSLASSNKPVLKTGIDFEMIQWFLDIHKNIDEATGVALPLLLPKVIALIGRATYLDRIHGRSDVETEILKQSIHFIQDNINKRLTVEEVADSVAMGYEKYRKLFQEQYGISPGSFIQNHRIRQSQKLLSGTSMTIKEVAIDLGYADSASFSKQFKKVTGYTPTRFREIYHP